jgi:hypothetical protein
VFDPEKPVSLLFDACAAIDKLCGGTGCGCGGLGWERTSLGTCIILLCFLPLVLRSMRSIIEATIERKTTAHGMMLWKYKSLNQKNAL